MDLAALSGALASRSARRGQASFCEVSAWLWNAALPASAGGEGLIFSPSAEAGGRQPSMRESARRRLSDES